MSYQGMHSKLVERVIGSANSCHSEFADTGPDGREIPIVLVPQSLFSCCCPFQFAVQVPSGPFILWQKWHKDMGNLTPGVRWIWPWYNRISHVITKATITYNAPAKACPTADNIMVNVDLSLTFRIGPDIDAAKNFVYRLGANRLDAMLSNVTEESIRGLVYSVTHDQVNDLREEFALGMLSTLNSKTAAFGVQVMNVKITEVVLPRELWQRLERTTAFKTKLGEQEKTHENRVKVLQDEHVKTIQTINKENDRKIQNVKAEQQRFVIERREMEEKALGEARVKEVNAMSKADVQMKKALGDEKASKLTARQKAENKLKQAEVECEKMKIDAEQQARVSIKENEAKLKVSESNAEAMIARAEAEEKGAKALAEKRRYELEWARIGVLQKMAGQSGRRLFISGEKGRDIMKDLVPQAKPENGKSNSNPYRVP
eukprot:CAMPEP_0196825052 /NCGR_PEP_ID=MMETSP1362-20130617/92831_1 /TAXON_ID=163516 /ORGANISM="Leptocylindrus danicus, Strain CCMP1856" /LENGTH=430 /DNA_ID=CAMNT_0042205421 /DNA_START=506 /DNA_END=1798 /DNA_ORIENTATION=+